MFDDFMVEDAVNIFYEDSNDSGIVIHAKPLSGFNNVKFGMDRAKVRMLLKARPSIFRKGKSGRNTTDDFGYCHAYYDKNDKLEAVEFFSEATVIVGGKTIMPGEFNDARKCFHDLKNDGVMKNGNGGFISVKKSVGITVRNNKVHSVLFARRGYYAK